MRPTDWMPSILPYEDLDASTANSSLASQIKRSESKYNLNANVTKSDFIAKSCADWMKG